MNLSDIYKKAVEQKDRQFEVLKSDGRQSGNHMVLIDPFGQQAAKLTHMYDRAIATRAKKFNEDNAELLQRSTDEQDFTEFNIAFEQSCQDIRDAFAVELVAGWDFDNEYTTAALREAVEGFRYPLVFSLERQIINAFKSILEDHAKK